MLCGLRLFYRAVLQVYIIQVVIDSTIWIVERRYSDFVAFDLQRFEDRTKSFLPPKKLVGNLVRLSHLESLREYW